MRRILTVDDSSSVRQMVSFTLRKAGYEVGEAVDGQDALAKIGQEKFDMIITDLNMPHACPASAGCPCRRATSPSGWMAVSR